jgi:hydroxymethylglutaryl-CoA reductase
MTSSRIEGFYKLSLEERRARILGSEQAAITLESGGLTAARADQIVENVLGIYALPFGVALNARINKADRLIPMVVEEPSVIAAASNACKMIRAGGGFQATMAEGLMIAQIEIRSVKDIDLAKKRLSTEKPTLLEEANARLPGLVRRGGGARDLELRTLAPGHAVIHLLVDCKDAMGANLVNTAAEALGPRLARLCEADLGLCILSNLSDRRMVTVEALAPFSALTPSGNPEDGAAVARAIEGASMFAELDPYRAATHNKGIMNGVDSVIIATGNDYRAVEAGAHAFAAQSGKYSPLSTWRTCDKGVKGILRMPLAVGIVGGTLRVHDGARLALELAHIKSASDLAQLAACAGLASNLAALRALSTEGIQRGHMSLHARSVAIAAGAIGAEVDQVAETIARAKDVTLQAATDALVLLRSKSTGQTPG